MSGLKLMQNLKSELPEGSFKPNKSICQNCKEFDGKNKRDYCNRHENNIYHVNFCYWEYYKPKSNLKSFLTPEPIKAKPKKSKDTCLKCKEKPIILDFDNNKWDCIRCGASGEIINLNNSYKVVLGQRKITDFF